MKINQLDVVWHLLFNNGLVNKVQIFCNGVRNLIMLVRYLALK